MTYCKEQNKSGEVMEGRKIYGKLQPSIKFRPWKSTPGITNRGEKIRDSDPDIHYEK